MSSIDKILICIVLATVGALTVETMMLARQRDATAKIALSRDTLAAHFDTSRAIILSARDSLRILGDTLAAQQRRVIQTAQRSDALDKALGLQRIAIGELSAQVKALAVHVQSTGAVATDTANGTRSAHFDVDQPPYSGTADVALPVSGRGTLDLRIGLPPATIGLRLGCGAPVDGIKPATAIATSPPWLTVTVGRVEQSPDLCASPALAPKRSLVRRALDRVGIDLGYGITDAAGKLYVGPQLSAAVKLWP